MPKCLNDPKKSYKGTEPSPKGLGYCAGKMKVGEKKKGTDGNVWIVKKVKNGSKRWMKTDKKVKGKKIVNYKYNLKYNFKPSKKGVKNIYEMYSDDPLFLSKLVGIKFEDENKVSEKEFKNVVKKIKEQQTQRKIIKVLNKKIPKSLIEDYQVRVGDVDKDIIEKAIRQFINNRYNEMSIFDFDIGYIYNSKGKDWSALTDTSPRELIKENIYLILTDKKNVESNFFKFFPV